jgi:hypothetical protein
MRHRKNYLEKVLFASDDYIETKLELIKYLKELTYKIEDFDNPLYTSRHNDGGSGHIGSIDWYASEIPKLVVMMRKARDFDKKTQEKKQEIISKLK